MWSEKLIKVSPTEEVKSYKATVLSQSVSGGFTQLHETESKWTSSGCILEVKVRPHCNLEVMDKKDRKVLRFLQGAMG